MSDNNTDGGGGGGFNSSLSSTKRSHDAMAKMEIENNDDDTSKSNNDMTKTASLDTLFTNSMERLKLAQIELALAQMQMEDTRQKIHASGNFEPDSLLFLCDGEDNNILSYIMDYLAVEDVGRCEMVCSILKKQARLHVWGTLDEAMFTNNPTIRSPSAENCSREAVIRYTVASTLAKRIGDMKDLISRHMVVQNDEPNRYTSTDVRIDNECEGCDFPNLNLNPFRLETSDEYEIFVRFCRTSDNKLLAEGFCPYDIDASCVYRHMTAIKIRNLDYSEWPKLVELTRLIETSEGDRPFDNDHNNNILKVCMRDLTVVVIGVHKGTSEASLAIAQCNFGEEISQWDSIECDPQGQMSEKSHGGVKTRLYIGEMSGYYENVLCNATLGMICDRQRTDQESGGILNKECHWKLACNCSYPRDQSDY